MSVVMNLLINALAVFVTAYILPGVKVDSFITAVIVAVVLAVVNALLKPIIILLTLPINIITLGLFTFIINGLLILLVSNIVKGFSVENILWAIIFSLVVSIVNSVLHGLTK